jgi:pimeloyl-ACP methyl ester carboxylesterase
VNDAGPLPSRGWGPVFFRYKEFVVLAGVLAFLAIALGVGVYFVQTPLAFPHPPPSAAQPQELAIAKGESIWLDVDGKRVEAWFLPAATQSAAPLIVYTHGNGELIDFWAQAFEPLRAAGFHVLLVEYPGYGRSGGKPSERSITATLLVAYDRVTQDPRVDATRVIGYGRSMGGGAIAQLAARRPLAALILESTFTSLTDMIRAYHVPRWLIVNHFDTRKVLESFKRPVLLLHGTQDEVIPVAQVYALKAVAPGAELHLMDCGHNNCPPHWELLRRFLESNGVCKNPDQEAGHETINHC